MKKSQAAMEFLVTYGWAILASLIAIGALAYFGFSDLGGKLPDKCLFSNNIECSDYVIIESSSIVKLKLVNGVGQTIYNPVGNAEAGQTSNTCDFVPVQTEWAPDEIREMSCDMTGAQFIAKEKTKVRFTLNYQKTPTGYVQTAVGELYTAPQ